MSLKLPLYEWCIILLFCAILLMLAGFVALGRIHSKTLVPINLAESQIHLSSELQETMIDVKIDGQVAKPGPYHIRIGTSLKELVEQAQPLTTADLSQLKWRKKLRDGQHIHVPERIWIMIQIEGAVRQPGKMKILSGTRLCELADQLQVLPEADLKSISTKKRFLHEGDVVKVALKKVKGQKGRK